MIDKNNVIDKIKTGDWYASIGDPTAKSQVDLMLSDVVDAIFDELTTSAEVKTNLNTINLVGITAGGNPLLGSADVIGGIQ